MNHAVINIASENSDFSPLETRDRNVRKIVIGQSPTDRSAKPIAVPELPYFDVEFRNLTHFYLWSSTGVSKVPTLPNCLQVLEVRSSADLTTIESLPGSLEQLILEDNPNLSTLPARHGHTFESLVELSLAGCPLIDSEWINQLIKLSPNLKRIELSRCPQVVHLPVELPRMLDRLDLNECGQLVGLPDPLPLTLRRIGLQGARKLNALPALPRDIDYLDLSGTTSLTQLPSLPPLKKEGEEKPLGDLRSLFLCGSGILEPPASEHGSSPSTNVSRETREYFEDVRLVGPGKVRRCKLLLLGNGSAGKTSLSLNLNPHYINRDAKVGGHHPGSTHGVQFWDWPDFEARLSKNDQPQKVNLHLWDFGGQEIYHSTHRLFVSRGSVFLVLWNPEQDGKQPLEQDGYQDVWYPVRYWLDYIHMECPHTVPLIAIVCTHQAKKWNTTDPEQKKKLRQSLEGRLRRDIGDEYADRIPLFILDSESESGVGEREEVEQWVQQSVHRLVDAQGTCVPTHWEVAQNMVEKWLPGPQGTNGNRIVTPATSHAEYSRISLQAFRDKLHDAIMNEIDTPDQRGTDFGLLRQNYGKGDFLNERRLQRTLRFLTHSGWVYWKDDLDQSRVIIDQRWALDTAYSTLERRKTSVRKHLLDAGGRFTFSDLQSGYWRDQGIDEDDQRLMLSFMESIGVCFPISRHWRSTDTQTVYVSPTHLPDSADLCNSFDAEHPDQTQETVECRQLHQGHWFAILREIGRRYGDEATYTNDACLIRGSTYRWNQQDKTWSALLRFRLDNLTKGLGGKVFISVVGKAVAERLPVLKSFVESFLPGFDGKASEAVREFDHVYCQPAEHLPTVFFSYAWDPVEKKGYYEEPVDAIYDALKPFHQKAVLLKRDQETMNEGDYISEYAINAGALNTSYVIVFTSDKYWLSWWCMLEFCSLLESLKRAGKGVETTVLLIEHHTGLLKTEHDVGVFTDKWKQIKRCVTSRETIAEDSIPKRPPRQFARLDKGWYIDEFIHAIQHDSEPLTADALKIRRVWKKEDGADIVAWVKQKLGLPTDQL
ncbi:MAG: hypothetical protein KDA89_04540 [Planctomycetaceae bacterium]|nr:hypothetical protein [Planctomycetaceae bacterium]